MDNVVLVNHLRLLTEELLPKIMEKTDKPDFYRGRMQEMSYRLEELERKNVRKKREGPTVRGKGILKRKGKRKYRFVTKGKRKGV